jgi:hypothetical protein
MEAMKMIAGLGVIIFGVSLFMHYSTGMPIMHAILLHTMYCVIGMGMAIAYERWR